MLPRHTHDCNACEFHGYFGGYDVYTCGQGGLGSTMIARWGNDGPEYQSLPVQLYERVADTSPLWRGVKALIDINTDPDQSYVMWK